MSSSTPFPGKYDTQLPPLEKLSLKEIGIEYEIQHGVFDIDEISLRTQEIDFDNINFTYY